MQSSYLAGAAADDERTKPPSRVRRGGQQRQRRQQVDVPRVGVVLEPERETAPVTAMCGAAVSYGLAERPWRVAASYGTRAVCGLWRLLPPVTEHVRSDVLAQKIGAAAAGRRAVH